MDRGPPRKPPVGYWLVQTSPRGEVKSLREILSLLEFPIFHEVTSFSEGSSLSRDPMDTPLLL
jgi:hypothetical protein